MDKKETHQWYSPYLESRTKRCFDIVVCLILFVPAVAIITLLAVTVLIIDGWPIFFVQKRVGKNGRLFSMPKIRSLIINVDSIRPSYNCEIDSFTTLTGRFLRKHRLDEVVQIFSVLIGQMSLVGPRPELPKVVSGYCKKASKRLNAKPGITGLWQIRAKRNGPIHQDIMYDLYYLRKASLWLDIKILIQTVPFVLNLRFKKIHEKNSVYTYDVSMSK